MVIICGVLQKEPSPHQDRYRCRCRHCGMTAIRSCHLEAARSLQGCGGFGFTLRWIILVCGRSLGTISGNQFSGLSHRASRSESKPRTSMCEVACAVPSPVTGFPLTRAYKLESALVTRKRQPQWAEDAMSFSTFVSQNKGRLVVVPGVWRGIRDLPRVVASSRPPMARP